MKTGSGWRTNSFKPFCYENNGIVDKYRYGKHRVSARVEWYWPDETPGILQRTSAAQVCDIFYAYETTDEIDGDRLTRFCGRTYRPSRWNATTYSVEQANVTRIALVVEGYMPDDLSLAYPENTVYFDNVSFFEAPPINQVYGALPGTESRLYSDASFQNPLDLKMTLNDIQTVQPDENSTDSYLLFSGSLINDDHDPGTNMPPRSIDLGFAFPILDNTSTGSATQQLEWHYDVNRATYVDILDDPGIAELNKMYPYSMASQVDARPAYEMSEEAAPIGVLRDRTLGLQVSSYPIGALAIHDPGDPSNLRGLSFGDSIDDPETPGKDPITPDISHFGYRIDQLAWNGTSDFVGYAYVEISLGLLAENAASGNSTSFSFVLFRSDDPDYIEQSVFREGLDKYQRSFYSDYFTRPVNTRPGEGEWLFGGAHYVHDIDDAEQDGLDDRPNEFGIRYEQLTHTIPGIDDIRDHLATLRGKNVSAVAYDFPWSANFTDETPSSSMNTIASLEAEANDEPNSLPNPRKLIYQKKLYRMMTLPPQNQLLFSKIIEKRNRYSFPVAVAMTPTVGPGNDFLVDTEVASFKSWYQSYSSDPHLIAGVEFDNTFRECHVDLTNSRVSSFAANGGSLTYSFNEFRPAVPQLTTNTWFFPHVETILADVDNNTDGQFPNFGDGSDAGDPPSNQEEEIISINANENEFGGTKYAIMYADVIAFESSPQRDFNNSHESFDYRRSLARDKAVSRALLPADCAAAAGSSIPYGIGSGFLYTDRDQLHVQILNEATWSSLAYGFMPAIHNLFTIGFGECFPADSYFDEFIDDYARDLFWTNPGPPWSPDPRRGYTNIFRMLHKAGWRPVTNVINLAETATANRNLVVHRFGPHEGLGPVNRPIYLAVYNNEELTLTVTDVAEYRCGDCMPIGTLESEEEVEYYDICEKNYGSSAFDEKAKNDLDANFFAAKDKWFKLEIANLDELTLDGVGNIKAHQMIENPSATNAPVNDPAIPAEIFGTTGAEYSIIRIQDGLGTPPRLHLGGPRAAGEQQPERLIEDKALMVFKIWLEPQGDNSPSGGGRDGDTGSADYRTIGRGWSTVDDENAVNGSVDYISTTIPGACALYRIDTSFNGRHRLRVKLPSYQDAASAARYDVYVVNHLGESIHDLTLESLPEPSLSVVLDQAQYWSTDVDEDGFAAVGEFEVSGLAEYAQASVVIRVSAEPDETGYATPGLLIADAVKLEAVE